MSPDWRENIQKEFPPGGPLLTTVEDPDHLLTEERIQQDLRARGYELLWFEDPIAFRLAYERDFRAAWDTGATPNLVILWDGPSEGCKALPFDVEARARPLRFSLAELFPRLDASIVGELERSYLDRLYAAAVQTTPTYRSERETKDYVLKHVFRIVPEIIQNGPDLIRVLLRRHAEDQRIPEVLEQHLLRVLETGKSFREWPLREIVTNRQAFINFLQNQWKLFLSGHPGLLVPFGDSDVRSAIRDLFAEGFLHPEPWQGDVPEPWINFGIQRDIAAETRARFHRLREVVEEHLPAIDSSHADWLTFAQRWGQLLYMGDPGWEMRQRVNERFSPWLNARYPGLHNLASATPVMVHRIAPWLRRRRDESDRVALIVVDCLSFMLWPMLKEALTSYRLTEHATFAWVPTLTSVSRQAIFSGKRPYEFASSIESTSREETAWLEFWTADRLTRQQVLYWKESDSEENLAEFTQAVSQREPKVIGAVLGTVDEIAHGMVLGESGLKQQVRQWVHRGYILRMLSFLLGKGYDVVLASDHGNMEARGCGRLNEGVLAGMRGERVRVYPTELSCTNAAARSPGASVWSPVGLPQNFYPLVASYGRAFVKEQDCIVTHGGTALEEVIVPLIEVSAK